MATTIVTKYGGDAPAASDIVRGELAVDTENGRLYTENAAGAVVEIGLNPSGNITFGDNSKAIFGAGSDLEIYHTGSDSRILDNGTGNLRIMANNLRMQSALGEQYIIADDGGAVTLYNDNTARLATTSSGIDITGTVTADGLTVGNGTQQSRFYIDADEVSQLIDGSVRYDIWTGGNKTMRLDANGDISFYEDTGTTPKLFWDASAEALGIGTSSLTSNASLSIAQGGVHVDGGASGGASQVILSTGASSGANFGQISNTGTRWSLGYGGTQQTVGTEVLTWNSSGDVEIFGENPANSLLGQLSVKSTNALANGNVSGISLWAQTSSGLGAYASIQAVTTGDYTGNLVFTTRNGAGTFDPRMTIDASGNLLLNTTNSPTTTKAIISSDYSATGTTNTGLTIAGRQSGNWWNNGIHALGASGLVFSTGTTGTTGADATNERMRIDASGNLLVSDTTANPSGDNVDSGIALHNAGLVRASTNNAAAPLDLNVKGRDGTIAEFRKDGAAVGSIGSYNGTDLYIGDGEAGVKFSNDNNNIIPWNTSTNASRDNNTDLGGSGTSDRFRNLYLSGNVTQGTTPSSSAAGVFTEAVGRTTYSRGSSTGGFSHLLFINGNGTVGTIQTNGSATAYNTSSDYRLKENVVAMSGATERLKQLKPSRFNFIADADTTVDGFLAHEVQDIVPEAITGTKDAVDADGNPEYQGIDQSKLVPLLVATIQELEARIAALES